MARFALRVLPAFLAAGLAGGAAIAATPSGWAVDKSADSPATFHRALDGVTIEYHYLPGEYDWMQLTVDACGSGPWHIKDDIDPPGETIAQHGYYVRKVIAEDFRNARLNCQIPDGIEIRILEGFDTAYAQFENLKTHAQTH